MKKTTKTEISTSSAHENAMREIKKILRYLNEDAIAAAVKEANNDIAQALKSLGYDPTRIKWVKPFSW